MKRILLATVVLLSGINLFAQAQMQITSRKEKLSDFVTKTTEIVLTGDDVIDQSLMEGFRASWNISAVEFISFEEFSKMKDKSKYYFVISTKNKFKKEDTPGIMSFSVVKGGTSDKIDDMLEVTTLPICAADEPSGREIVFMPAMISILQRKVSEEVYGGTTWFIQGKLPKNATVVIAKEDLSDEQSILPMAAKNLEFCTEDEADDAFIAGEEGVFVGYVVAPSNPSKGSVCFKFLIDSRTHEIRWHSKHKISASMPSGFLPGDIKNILFLLK